MRIRLQKNKQTELINLAKKKKTWIQLSSELKFTSNYMANELKKEKTLLSEDSYNKLCKITRKNYNRFILKKLHDNWGMKKGGTNSRGNTKTFAEPIESEILAELFGIILGDGHVSSYIKDKKNRHYTLTISGHATDDYEYLSSYVSNIIKKLLDEQTYIRKISKSNKMFMSIHGKNIIKFLQKKGLKSGNKKSNNQGIPLWILKNKKYLKACLRGLIDTDGSVHYIAKNNKNLRISFTNYIEKLMYDVRQSLIQFDLHPSKIIRGNQIFLSRKSDIFIYLKEIGFSNQKHLKRLESLRNKAPVM